MNNKIFTINIFIIFFFYLSNLSFSAFTDIKQITNYDNISINPALYHTDDELDLFFIDSRNTIPDIYHTKKNIIDSTFENETKFTNNRNIVDFSIDNNYGITAVVWTDESGVNYKKIYLKYYDNNTYSSIISIGDTWGFNYTSPVVKVISSTELLFLWIDESILPFSGKKGIVSSIYNTDLKLLYPFQKITEDFNNVRKPNIHIINDDIYLLWIDSFDTNSVLLYKKYQTDNYDTYLTAEKIIDYNIKHCDTYIYVSYIIENNSVRTNRIDILDHNFNYINSINLIDNINKIKFFEKNHKLYLFTNKKHSNLYYNIFYECINLSNLSTCETAWITEYTENIDSFDVTPFDNDYLIVWSKKVSNSNKELFYIQKDSIGPKSTITTNPNSPVKSGIVNLTLNLTDNITQTPELKLLLQNDTIDINLSGNDAEWTGNFIIPSNIESGTYSFTYYGIDIYNNTSTIIVAGSTIVIDNKLPECEIIHPSDNFKNGINTFYLTFSEKISNITNFKIIDASNNVFNINDILYNNNDTEYKIIIPSNFTEGTAAYTIKYYDMADNYNDTFSTGQTIYIDKTIYPDEPGKSRIYCTDNYNSYIEFDNYTFDHPVKIQFAKYNVLDISQKLNTRYHFMSRYRISLTDINNNTIYDGLNTTATLKLQYSESELNNFPEYSIRCGFWDGNNFVPVKSEIDVDSNICTVRTAHLTDWILINIIEGIPKTHDGVSPNPFTPGTNSEYSKTYFRFNDDIPEQIEIYNINGDIIRTITNINYWDGKNDFNQFVNGGIYIYKYKSDDEYYYGSILCIR